MALSYLPCFGEARVMLRSCVCSPLSIGIIDKRSGFPCNTTSSWSINVKRYHVRRHRQDVPLPFQLNPAQVTRTLQRPCILISTASVAQSNRPAVTSEERSSGALLTFSYASQILSGEDGDADGGRALRSSGGIDSRERLRRDRIARANKGKVPWNKGRRHSPETIAKIKERTKTAMLNPQIRDKLRQYGKNQTRNQTLETKSKIREKLVGFWERKRIVKETEALFERKWKEVIAEAARMGVPGEEELEWDSYRKTKEQYKLEDVKVARQEKVVLRALLKSKRQRKPVSEAHRKAISDAIRAKWADPEYQARVSAGMAKSEAEKRRKDPPMRTYKKRVRTYQKRVSPSKASKSTLAVSEETRIEQKKPSQALSADEDFIAEVLAEEVTLQTRRKRSTAARIKGPQKVTLVSLEDHNLSPGDDTEATGSTVGECAGHEEVPWATEWPVAETDVRTPTADPADVQLSSKLSSQSYKDPLVLEKVQRIQQLRQGRLELELKRKEAADRARMLIANAERAANALEQAGNADAAMLSTLREARRVLAEATRSVQAAALRPGSAAGKSTLSGGSKAKKDRAKAASVVGFHDRMWTEGDSIQDCPHPIPIRLGKFSSREDQQQQSHVDEVGGTLTSGGKLSGSAGGTVSTAGITKEVEIEEGAEGQAPGSTGQHDEPVPGEGCRIAAAAPEGSRSSKAGPRSVKTQSTSGNQKRWHRGRLIIMEDVDRTCQLRSIGLRYRIALL